MTTPKLRPDIDFLRAQSGERRADARLRAHHELELELAARLRTASSLDRSRVYSEVYSTLFANLPDHPQNTKRRSSFARLEAEFRNIARFLHPGSTFLEIGCGDGALAMRVAPQLAESFGMDVTEALIPRRRPANFRFILTDGVTIPLESGAIDFAYSNQLMEHLHPDDAAGQLLEIARVLSPGGHYYCSTPSRASGPHDISRYFGYEARGFHLKEYDYAELWGLFRKAGFRRVEVLVGSGEKSCHAPFPLVRALELLVTVMPRRLRTRIASNRYAAAVLGIQILGMK